MRGARRQAQTGARMVVGRALRQPTEPPASRQPTEPTEPPAPRQPPEPTRRPQILVTVIGSQGFILGRGNQLISPRVIARVGKDRIRVMATREKVSTLGGRPLLVDTGDLALDASLAGYIRVPTSPD